MTKLTKISAAALFALFLTACDKPASNTADATKADATKAETTQTQTAAPLSAEELAQGKADFQKLLEWNKAQEGKANEANKNLQEKLASKDPKQIEAAIVEFTKAVGEIVKSLDTVEVKNALINTFKEKTKAVLSLSNEVIVDSLKINEKSTDEVKSALKAKVEQRAKLSEELQNLQTELQQTFGN